MPKKIDFFSIYLGVDCFVFVDGLLDQFRADWHQLEL